MQPKKADNPAIPYQLWREATGGGGALVADERAVVTRVRQGADGTGGASFRIITQETPSATGPPRFAQLGEADIDRLYGPTVRCAVASRSGTAVDILAHGWPLKRNLRFGRSGQRDFWDDSIQLEPAIARLGRTSSAQVWGRCMLSRAATDDLGHDDGSIADDIPISSAEVTDADFGALVALVASLPVIFNPVGRDSSGGAVLMPNRSRRPVLPRGPNAPTFAGGPVNSGVYLFTYEGDPNARHWTYLQALQYLVAVHGVDRAQFAVEFNDLWSDLLAGTAGDPIWPLDETDVSVPDTRAAQGWREHMTRRCQSLSVEGINLVEAIGAIGRATGMRMYERHELVASNQDTISVRTQMAFTTPGDIAADTIAVQSAGEPSAQHSHRDAAGKLVTIDDLLANNNVASATLQRDFGNAASQVTVLGGRRLIQITQELKPLWPPDPEWDDVPDVDAVRTAAYSEPFETIKGSIFYDNYHAKGQFFGQSANRIGGRLWGADFGGELDPSNMNRTTGPWTDYSQPARLGDLTNTLVPLTDEVRRRRQMLDTLVTDGAQRRDGVLVEISIDSGSTWSRLPITTKLETLPTRFALWLAVDDLLTIGRDPVDANGDSILFAPGGAVDNYYHAYLTGVLRMRVTCVTDLDARMVKSVFSSTSALAAHDVDKVISRKRDFRSLDGSFHADNTLAGQAADIDDGPSASRMARDVLRRVEGAALRGDPIIPWIESSRYPVGTPISGIRRTPNATVDISFGGDAGRSDDYPIVVQKIYLLDGERSTQLVLADGELRRANGRTR